ncbi:Stromal membrane-associated protein [Entamoeba marina]
MDCQAMGPVYVVLDFGTFVCQTCSGIHREFSHRVKSISMASFKPEEMKKIKEMGNEKAKRIWLAKWTTADYQIPESGNQRKIRDFIHLKYKDKKWFDQDAFDAISAGKPVQPVSNIPVVKEVKSQPKQQQQPKQTPADVFWKDDDNVGPIPQKTTAGGNQQQNLFDNAPKKKVDFMELFDNAMKQPAPQPQQQPQQPQQTFDLFGNVQQQPQMQQPQMQQPHQQPQMQQPQQTFDLFGNNQQQSQMQQTYQQQPMFQQPMYQQPMFQQPMFQQPQQPMYQQPMFQQQPPMFQQPQQPMYQQSTPQQEHKQTPTKPKPVDVFASLGSYQQKT